jgi:ABC-type transport system involved in cytochrome c biogenesis permease subunit
MSAVTLLQSGVAALYLVAVVLLWPQHRVGLGRLAIGLALLGLVLHLGLLAWRWHDIGQIPIVTRYEDLTVDSVMIVVVYLAVQWRLPELRQAGLLTMTVAGLGVAWALFHSQGSFPMDPSLRTNWLIIHAQLNSLAIAAGSLAAAVHAGWLAGRIRSPDLPALASRLAAWAFLLWAAMLAAGSYWASLAWGRYWGWDPIESWSLATLTAYAFVLHLREKSAWRGRRWAVAALAPYAMMLFTTYGLLLVRHSIHGQYLFQ